MILQRSRVGGIVAPLPLSRWEPTRSGLDGTGIFCVDDLIDPTGQLVDFFISAPSLLETKGGLSIRHASKVSPIYGTDYVIYANARIVLRGPCVSKSLVPPRWTPPQPSENIWLAGPGNLHPITASQKYAAPHLNTQVVIQPGYYALEVWASAGTDGFDIDGLGELVPYNSHISQQFHVKVSPIV